MSLSSKQLEDEIAAMENRLANVKVVVEIEKHAWKKVARKGKSGTKWKGAVTNSAKVGVASAATSSRSEVENSEGEIVIEPMQWDSLELAQYLQSKQLAPYAQIVVYEHITGKLLLDTAPGKLRNLFEGIVTGKNDPTWKAFLRVCSQLHKMQKSMHSTQLTTNDDDGDEDRSEGRPMRSSPPKASSSSTVFPLISPRMPAALTASSLSTKSQKSQPPPPTASLLVGDPDGPRLKTPISQAMARKTGAASHTQQMVTCWNCSARFPRILPTAIPSRSGPTTSPAVAKAAVTKLYCSKACQDAIESSDLNVSASLSLAVPLTTVQQAPKPPPPHATTLAAVVKSPRHRPPGLTSSTDKFSFLHVAHTGPVPVPTTLDPSSANGLAKQSNGRKRLIAPSTHNGSTSAISSVASITAVRCLPDDALPPNLLLHGAKPTYHQSRVFQQSRYKLDPELFHANGANWVSCFDATAPLSPTMKQIHGGGYRLTNLDTVVSFLSNKAVYRLSLTCRKWFEIVHLHPLTVDRVWALILQRTWIQDEGDLACLRDLGFVSTKTKKPRRVMLKLTRQVQKAVLDGMKILSSAENWQLAPTCRNDLEYLPIPQRKWQWAAMNAHGEDSDAAIREPVDRGNDLYEVITVICNRACEIVAVQAQELIRPIAEDGSTIEILNGVKNGSLWSVECRRLRLFSLANRLPFSEWYLLPDILVTLEFCTVHRGSHSASSELTAWQLKVLSRLQVQMDKRLLAKESVQQVMKWAQERNAPQQALEAMEQFLVHHAPALFAGGANAKTRG